MRARVDIINDAARDVAVRWANASREALRVEGRASAGCFAGTLREAHARFAPHVRLELARHGMEALSPDELDATTRDAYRKAKKVWQDLQR